MAKDATAAGAMTTSPDLSSAVTAKKSSSSSSGNAGMKNRLTALLRKAKIQETDEGAAPLLELLLRVVRTKREYEDVLGSEEDAEAFVRRHKLPANQERVLIAMQSAKDIFTPNRFLDGIITSIFLLQVALVGFEMYSRGLGAYYLALCFLVDAVVHRVKDVSTFSGNWISNFIYSRGYVDSPPLAGAIQMKKWQEQSWQLFVHVSMTIVEAYILYEEEWWRDPRTCWVPHPSEQRATVRTDLQVLYLTQLAVWMYTCFIHRFVDERRKDYFVMYTHHIVTIALVGVSWAVGYLRIGIIVLFVHDVSDILVDALKMVNYLKLDGARGFFASEITYVACVLSWLYWRLWEYPFRVIRGSFLIPFALLLRAPRDPQTIPYINVEYYPADLPWHFEMNILLMTLLGMHIYWFHLFIMIGYRMLTESVREASRQEYEGDSEDEGEGEGGDRKGSSGRQQGKRKQLTENANSNNNNGSDSMGGGKGTSNGDVSNNKVASPPVSSKKTK